MTLSQSIDFVIPDHLLAAGAAVLARQPHLALCPDDQLCLTSSTERYTPVPAFHAHLEDSEISVTLYLQSETLWFLPPLDSTLCQKPAQLPQYFIMASDRTVLQPWRPGRGSGVFKYASDPVIVPTAPVLLEAFLRLYARDQGKRVGGFGMAMIAYMEEYVDDDGNLDASQLPEPLRTFYRDLREGEKPVRQWTTELKAALGVGESGDAIAPPKGRGSPTKTAEKAAA